MGNVLRRKVRLAAAAMRGGDGGDPPGDSITPTGAGHGRPGVDRGWRIALARAAQDRMGLALDVVRLTQDRRTLGELLELPPDLAFLAVLEGPAEALGLIVLSPPVLAGLIEAQTTGRVTAQTPPPRRPTRIDAAMVATLIDAALAGLDHALIDEADLDWAGGYRYASFIDEARALGLLLEDIPYRVLVAETVLAGGARVGPVILALPAETRGHRIAPPVPDDVPAAPPAFAEDLARTVLGANAELDGVIARVTLPLHVVMGLRAGDVLPLGAAQLDRVVLEGVDGRPMAQAHLGQNRGMRALRLGEPTSDRAARTATLPFQPPEDPTGTADLPHLATGTG